MLLPRFDVHRPAAVPEACALLSELGKGARPLAGGTDLLVSLKKGLIEVAHLVSLDRLDELEALASAGPCLNLGARVSAARIEESRTVRRFIPVLAEAAGHLGPPLVRNRATIGGSIVTARPAADLLPALLVLGASVEIADAAGARDCPLADFFLGPGETRLRPAQIVTKITVPRPAPGSGAAYLKLGVRQICEISIVNAAALLTLSPSGRRIREARLVLGAVAPTPMRCPKTERSLKGAAPSGPALDRAATTAAEEARPITDHRGSSDYRRRMAEVLARRALRLALERARESRS
jgi:carbon-monoxide dehydrogenase medium subunit